LFVFRRKIKFQPKLTSATAFLFVVSKTYLGDSLFLFCQQNLRPYFVEKFFAWGGLTVEQAKITCFSHSFFPVIKSKIKKTKKKNTKPQGPVV
jgi:hypothetical protein